MLLHEFIVIFLVLLNYNSVSFIINTYQKYNEYIIIIKYLTKFEIKMNLDFFKTLNPSFIFTNKLLCF